MCSLREFRNAFTLQGDQILIYCLCYQYPRSSRNYHGNCVLIGAAKSLQDHDPFRNAHASVTRCHCHAIQRPFYGDWLICKWRKWLLKFAIWRRWRLRLAVRRLKFACSFEYVRHYYGACHLAMAEAALCNLATEIIDYVHNSQSRGMVIVCSVIRQVHSSIFFVLLAPRALFSSRYISSRYISARYIFAIFPQTPGCTCLCCE